MEPKKTNDPDELGGWRINGRLGEGGFGTVFLAEKGAQKAAIKIIRKEFVAEDDARARLATEADVLSKLSDPAIGKILDSDLSGDLPWIATEFINGPTLDDQVKYEGPLEEIAWFNLAANIFHAIVSANEIGIIHKDIKPSNIILGETGNKLIDFGIAHISGQTRSAVFGDREGSTPFSSPEHFTVKPNPKMDVFSTAATLAFAGKASSIWKGDNDLQLMRSINEDEPNLEGLTENQIKFLLPLLEKNPSDRPSAHSAHQSALGYIEFLLGKSKKPKPTQARTRIRKVLRVKQPVAIASAALIALFSFLGTNSAFQTTLLDIFGLQNSNLANECQNALRNGNFDNSIQICFRSIEAGNEQSNIYLARAYMAKKSDSEAKSILLKCKDQRIDCLSDYAQFFQTDEEAIKTLKYAYSKGNIDATWRIGQKYSKKNQYATALNWYKKGSEAKNAIANFNLAIYWGNDSRKQFAKAISYAKLSLGGDLTGLPSFLTIDNVVERYIDSLYVSSTDEVGRIQFLTNCAEKKTALCIDRLAEYYLLKNDYVNAKKWGTVGANLNNAKSMWVLGQVEAHKNSLLPKGTSDASIDAAIFSWYTKAAALEDVKSIGALGIGYLMGIGGLKPDLNQSCNWFQKAMTIISDRKGTWKAEPDDEKEYAQAAQFFELQNCQSRLLGATPALSFSSPSPKPSSNKKELPSVKPSPSPVLAYKTSEFSEKLSSDYKSTSIFGRAYLDGSNWIIPVTNSANEVVPPINRVQFRDSALPYGSWWNMPYTLESGGVTGWYAVVSDIGIQLLHSTGNKVCPEFRFALVENNLVTYIWTKSVAPCTPS